MLSVDRLFLRPAASVVIALSLAACAGHRDDEQIPTSTAALDDGTRIAFVHQGMPGHHPTVVFQSGLGNDHAAWVPVLRQLPVDTEAIAVDRPGYGASPARDGARDACRIAEEQRALLHKTGATPPYVLVGHSLGGLYQYVFARLYPDEVAGLVLLDATHPALLQTLQRETPGTAALLQLARHTVFSPAMRQEFDAQADCLTRVEARAPLHVPAMVLTSTRPAVYAGAELQATLDHLQQGWLPRTGAAALTPVAGSGHHIHRDAPQAVVQAIRSMADVAGKAL